MELTIEDLSSGKGRYKSVCKSDSRVDPNNFLTVLNQLRLDFLTCIGFLFFILYVLKVTF